ncbi:uncharacterized protein J4E78_005520 [Alternaria triticimaculans]|uniref:uncharacterized protein n=1 Tax=Alternaria triticimaculans TaxID=297637 RepID=UPI0020C362A4|nr:uncharacterized protein J4E78_005520 [Alternaria triticimaculans]KAI4659096.1 hypothetical protein J4E78_005520 [Alternaria triticimaculans]
MRSWSVLRSLAVVVPVACLMGGIQAGLIFAIQHAKSEGLHWPSILMAVASAALLAAGVLRHYVDVYVHRTVRGISFIFVGIDALGDLFSLVSVVFQPKLDVLGLVIYGSELVLWIGIFLCGAYYNLPSWYAAKKETERTNEGLDEPNSGPAGTSGIALHDLPSSTSVFRTPSGEIEAIRQRSMGSIRVAGLEHLPRRVNTRKSALSSNSIMTSTTTTKVTSLDSQSDGPSVPNPTPATESVGSPYEPVDPPPEMDYTAVARILGPIQESLNEAALEAAYPSPPINTPILGSPAPSVSYRFPVTRGRGFSVVGDRLAQLKINDRKLRHREGDVGSSNYSPEASINEDEEVDIASISEVLSDGGRDKEDPGQARKTLDPIDVTEGSVPIALGSPAVNPRIVEYLTFTSDDLPTNSVAPCFPSTLMKTSTASIKTIVGGSDGASLKSDGVTEKSNWAEEIEDMVDRTCLRLEQLADDEWKRDGSKSFADYYVARLERLLSSAKRSVPVSIQKNKENQE